VSYAPLLCALTSVRLLTAGLFGLRSEPQMEDMSLRVNVDTIIPYGLSPSSGSSPSEFEVVLKRGERCVNRYDECVGGW
jgi:hypothetical protein